MNKQIIISLSVIAAVAAIAIGGTVAYFTDTETSTGNTLTAGVIDIVVDEQNPWQGKFTEELTDMKPCQTRYIEFTVRNLEDSNPVNLWKHIHITDQNDGVITEPECDEGGGIWDQESIPQCGGEYVPRNNLAAYTIYDMYVCEDPEPVERCLTDENGKPQDEVNWRPIITESQYVRLDNIDSTWIYLGQLVPAKELKVVQSYHLSSWPDAPEPEVTNWAQGDEMVFDIELMATQLNAPGPKGAIALLTLENKNPTTWDPIIDGISGKLTYNTSGSTFDYDLTASGLAANINYSLIYYADPYPGNGGDGGGALIGTHMTDGAGAISALDQSVELDKDLPSVPDDNYPAGAKIWLVSSSDYDDTKLIAWNPTNYLFEMNLITYDDTDI